eukprot:CAMPEP_0182441788 /NCGR_PEP_ID=MMETSP1172-20130603/786_1 /TAXON_ID=708627 /ORGANISM="Timspurckia oligopyrenoides, Strain CCMP3278" /LENGTH=636 /DNA_ID=CAMNT_0024636321 /DNA_START=214 /DNA_END=2124 /DNA_ORIENTATION=+
MIVGRKASADGYPMVTHNDDCLDCDFRIGKMNAQEHGKHEVRELYEYRNRYPAKITDSRGPVWRRENLEKLPQASQWKFEPFGSIPQVKNTYGLIEGSYAIMNEKGLAIGESTCGAIWGSRPITQNGTAMFAIDSLMTIALERCSTAREAIQLMGDLATKYGFYVEDFRDLDLRMSGGEALNVIDSHEAWVFHIICDDTGSSAGWVAQKLGDDQFAIIANQFIIRDVIPDSKDFMYSSNLWDLAKRTGRWTPKDGPLDFTKVFSVYLNNDLIRSPYSTLRQWALLKAANPDLDIPLVTDPIASDYPFSVKPKNPLSVADMMSFTRNQFEGTEYDLTQGLSSGPYGDPDRFDRGYVEGLTPQELSLGGFPRGTSIHRTIYSFVAVSRGSKIHPVAAPLLWFVHHAPATSLFTPLYVATQSMPEGYSTGSHFKYTEKSTWWAALRVSNYGKKYYRFSKVDIKAFQNEHEKAMFDAVARMDEDIADARESDEIVSRLTEFSVKNGRATLDKLHELFDHLVTFYHDGGSLINQTAVDLTIKHLFYPSYWLDAANYWNAPMNRPPTGSLRVPDAPKIDIYPGMPGMRHSSVVVEQNKSSKGFLIQNMFTVVAVAAGLVVSFFAGSLFGRRWSKRESYSAIP